MAITRPLSSGHGGKRAGSFAGKSAGPASGPHPVGLLTRALSSGHGGKRTGLFSGKTAASSGAHPVGVLTRSGGAYGIRLAGSFVDKETGIVVPPEPASPAVGGGGGKRHKRRRILRKTIYGTVISLWQEEHHERPPVEIAHQITDQVAATYRDIEAEIAEIEIRTLIVRLIGQAMEEEDEETAILSML